MGFLERIERAGQKFKDFQKSGGGKAARWHKALEPFADALEGGANAGIGKISGSDMFAGGDPFGVAPPAFEKKAVPRKLGTVRDAFGNHPREIAFVDESGKILDDSPY